MRWTTWIIREGFDGVSCWAQSRIAVMDGLWLMNTQKLKLAGSDVYGLVHSCWSEDEGRSWSELEPQEDLYLPGASLADTTPKYHKKSGQMLLLGQKISYAGEAALGPLLDQIGESYYAVYDPLQRSWGRPAVPLDLEGRPLQNTYFGCIQRVDLADGDILIPMARRNWPGAADRTSHLVVMRFSFDGQTLQATATGQPIHADHEPRGLAEPSLIFYQGSYYLTMRSDTRGYVAKSRDGLNFSPLQEWRWDTGLLVPTYNTQSHWVSGREGLFLVYTRQDGKNDHVFRNRAPLYLARVDTGKLQLLRQTEKAITPERGARMGNFGALDLGPDQSIVTTTEWMQPLGCEKYGSNNAIFLTQLNWE